MMYPIPSVSQLTAERALRPFIVGHVHELLHHAANNPSYAGPNMSRWIRKNRNLGARDRKIVTELAYTLIRYEQWFIQVGLLNEEIHESSCLDTVLQWLHKPHTLEEIQFDLQTHLSISSELASEWEELLTDPTLFVHHYQNRAPIDLRTNHKRTSRKHVVRKLLQANIDANLIADLPWGIRVPPSTNIVNLGIYKQGLVEVQDAASQYFLAEVSRRCPEPCTILDYCAGAGGKSLGLAALGHTVFAHEPRSNACKEIQKRAQRAGLQIQNSLPNQLVDVVIVDAPCSGTGRLRREPTLRWRWRTEPPSSWISTQSRILQEAAQYCKPNGRVIYATCSLVSAENAHILSGYHAERHKIWGHHEQSDGFSWTVFTPEGVNHAQ